MKVCPRCELDASNEYTDSAKCCSECGSDLVDKLTFRSQINLPPPSLNKPALISAVLGIRNLPVQDTPESDVTRLKVCPQCELDASNEYTDSAVHCGKCGTELVDKLSLQSKNNIQLTRLAILLTVLGIPEMTEINAPRKSKKYALILAILLGPFTWLYTYRRDAMKAAIGLGLTAGAISWAIILFLILRFIVKTDNYADFPKVVLFIPFILVFVSVWMPLWLWAIIDVIKKKESSLTGRETRNKTTAVLLAVFLTPWTWFYTYQKDAWKFWLSFLNGGTLAIWIFMSSKLYMLDEYVKNMNNMNNVSPPFFTNMSVIIGAFSVVSLVLFICSIIIVAGRSVQWYQEFNKVEPD